MMTLLVRRPLPGGGKASRFYRFDGEIEHYDEAQRVRLVLHGVVTEKPEDTGQPVELELADGDVAHVVSSDGATVTSFRWRPPFAAARSGQRRTA